MISRSSYYVYILTNDLHSVLYTGVTSNLERRIYEHKNRKVNGFTKKYNLIYLIYFEECGDVNAAISREKQLKNWHRDWKIKLIKSVNPNFIDLSRQFFDAETSSA